MLLHELELAPFIVAPSDAGLIGDHGDGEAQGVCFGNAFDDTGDQDYIFDPMKIVRLLHQHAVPVEKQAGAAGKVRLRQSVTEQAGIRVDRRRPVHRLAAFRGRVISFRRS